MTTDPVKNYLARFSLEDRVMEFDVSSATVSDAAAALGVPFGQIAKTLSFKVKDGCILVVCAGDARIDNKKYKAMFHQKASFLTAEEVMSFTGKQIGGVCPFDLPSDIRVYLDISLQRFQTVYPAAGTSASAVRLSNDELYVASNALAWIDVCQLPE